MKTQATSNNSFLATVRPFLSATSGGSISRSRGAPRYLTLGTLLATFLMLTGPSVDTFAEKSHVTTEYIGGIGWHPADPPNPLPCPPPYPCPPIGFQVYSKKWQSYDPAAWNWEIATYTVNGSERIDLYTNSIQEANFPGNWKLIKTDTATYNCGPCSGGGYIHPYNVSNWANFLIYVTNNAVILEAPSNAWFINAISTPVAIDALRVYNLQSETVVAIYTNLGLPTNGTLTITNQLPIGVSAAIGAFVPGGRLDAFYPFRTTSNGIAPLKAYRTFSMDDPQAVRLSISSAVIGAQETAGLVQLPNLSVVFVTGCVSSPPNITAAVAGSGQTLQMSWPANTGWRLQAQTNSRTVGLSALNTNWFIVPGSGNTNLVEMPINRTDGCIFYRLFYGP